MRRARLVALTAAATVVAIAAAGRGCNEAVLTSPPTPASAPFPPFGTGASDAGARAQASSSADSGLIAPVGGASTWCGNPPIPAGVPSGWVPWNDYDRCCGFYVPSAPALLPSPIEWQPCEDFAQPSGISCREIAVNWAVPALQQSWPVQLGDWGWTRSDGVTLLSVARAVDGGWVDMIAEADGPVHMAVMSANVGVCRLDPAGVGLQDGRYVYQVYENNDAIAGGALAGSTDDAVPHAFGHFNDGVYHSYISGLPGVLDLATLDLYDWAQPPSATKIPITDHLIPTWGTFSGDALFLNTNGGLEERVWTAQKGTVDFLSFGGDFSQGADSFGTDGKDMAWVYGTGRTDPNGGLFTAVSIMTSPFTTDPAQVQPRRLRSDELYGYGTPFHVGCGYAARALSDGVRLVRLSDGVSWLLSADWHLHFQWIEPVAITCTELFAQVSVRTGDAWTLPKYARVRLDSLGPGVPPD